MMSEAPPDYDSATATRESTAPSINREYPTSRTGIIKMIEIVVSLITFICNMVNPWEGGGWVGFVSINGFISALIYFIFGLVNFYSITSRIIWPWKLIELIYCIIFTVFYLIAAIVATAFAARNYASVGVAAFFSFLGTAIFLIDTIRQYRTWNTSDSSGRTGAPATATATTTTTTTHYTTTRYAYNDSEPPKY